MSAGGSRRGIQRGTEMQSCGIGLFWLLVSLYEVVQNSAVLHHFVNRNEEEFKGGPRCRRDGLESRRGV